MSVIIKNGGKQYIADPGSILALEKINGAPGDIIKLDTITTIKDGNINLSQGFINAEIIKHYKDDKIIVFKKKKRNHYERKKGHRQHLTQVKIQD